MVFQASLFWGLGNLEVMQKNLSASSFFGFSFSYSNTLARQSYFCVHHKWHAETSERDSGWWW